MSQELAADKAYKTLSEVISMRTSNRLHKVIDYLGCGGRSFFRGDMSASRNNIKAGTGQEPADLLAYGYGEEWILRTPDNKHVSECAETVQWEISIQLQRTRRFKERSLNARQGKIFGISIYPAFRREVGRMAQVTKYERCL
jgi:alpha-D-ribose 1-methylphosphonate 5-triphosphate synthase subunit PhnG